MTMKSTDCSSKIRSWKHNAVKWTPFIRLMINPTPREPPGSTLFRNIGFDHTYLQPTKQALRQQLATMESMCSSLQKKKQTIKGDLKEQLNDLYRRIDVLSTEKTSLLVSDAQKQWCTCYTFGRVTGTSNLKSNLKSRL